VNIGDGLYPEILQVISPVSQLTSVAGIESNAPQNPTAPAS